MRQIWTGTVLVLTLCVAVSFSQAAPRGGGGRSGGGRAPSGKPPGGNWEAKAPHGASHQQPPHGGHQGKLGAGAAGERGSQQGRHNPRDNEAAGAGAAARNRRDGSDNGAEAAAIGRRRPSSPTGAEDAAAGAAVENRNQPQISNAGAAEAGAAAANRNQPKATGAQGAAAGAAAANRNQPELSGAAGAAVGYDAVRNSYNHHGVYGEAWYGDHPTAWVPAGMAAGAAWTPATWNTVAAQGGYAAAAPVPYNYGQNVTCVNGNVSVNGQPAGTAEEFSQAAADLAAQGDDAQASADETWLPLGVYALVRNENQHPQLILQLAINKSGIIRGNYTDEITDHVLPIKGAVDKKTQRAAWYVGDSKTSFMEAGLSNLTEASAPVLIHKNGKTQHWTLVRLEQPAK